MADDYEVGFGKPPKHTQFKKGASGNGKGRPKGTKNFKTDLEDEFHERISVKEDGKPTKVSKQRALIKKLMAKAVGGDIRAANLLFTMWLKFVPASTELTAEDELTPTDLQILEEFKQGVLQSAKKQKEKSND